MVPVVVVALVAAAVIAWQLVPRSTDARAERRPSPAAVSSTSASPTPAPSTTGPSRDEVAATVRACRARVSAGDRVLAAARTGVGHWAKHVQAQTDANAGRISVAEMDAIFSRTRLAGPDDQTRYAEALTAYRADDGSCAAVAGAPATSTATLDRCRQRDSEQRPLLKAAAPAMADWKSHLAAMARSRAHHMDDAEQIWVDAWRAAPPHIRAYQKAARGFDAPDC